MADNNDIIEEIHDGSDPFRELWRNVMLIPWKEERLWFFTSDRSNFEWICEMLGYDAESIRKIAKLKFSKRR